MIDRLQFRLVRLADRLAELVGMGWSEPDAAFRRMAAVLELENWPPKFSFLHTRASVGYWNVRYA